MSTTIQSGTKKISHKIWSDYRRYYYSELTITGKHPNRKFSIDLFSSESKDLGVALQIGTINPKTGALTLNSSASDKQQKDKAKIAKETKNSGTYWEGKIGDEGLKELSNQEKEKLGIASGNNNQSTDNTNGNSTDGSNNSTDGNGSNIAANGNGQKGNGDDGEVPYDFSFNTSIGTNIEIKGDRRKKYGNYYYPEDLSSNRQDRIRFTQKYTKGTVIQSTIKSGTKNFQRKEEKIKGSVTLPIVTGIEDTNQVDWQGARLNPIQALGASGALGLFQDIAGGETIDNAFTKAASAVGEIKNELIAGAGGDIRNAINVYLAGKAVGAQGLLSRTTGAVLNPNLEMLFGGPSLRSFAFSFLLSPRDADEADQVRKIIRFFKQGMSVKTTASNTFLKSPNVFDIQYQTFNTQGQEIVHPSINIIKTCALQSCNVRYTPNNSYMTYEDPYRTMTAYQMTLSFGELDPIYDSDYDELDNNDDQVIGY